MKAMSEPEELGFRLAGHAVCTALPPPSTVSRAAMVSIQVLTSKQIMLTTFYDPPPSLLVTTRASFKKRNGVLRAVAAVLGSNVAPVKRRSSSGSAGGGDRGLEGGEAALNAQG